MTANHIRVGTFNLYNLALPERPYYDRQYTRGDYRQKVEWLQQQLTKMRGDLIGFQEVFHQAALEDVLRGVSHYDDCRMLVAPEQRRTPSVGLVTRFEVLDHTFVTDFPEDAILEIEDMAIPITRFSRPVLRARLRIRGALYVTVFVTHLKSKNPLIPEGVDRHDPVERAIGKARSLIKRAAEATAVRCLLLAHLAHNNEPVIVMGDINDTGHAVTSEIMTGSPPWRTLPFEKKLRNWDVLLYNVKDIQARQSYRDVYYTHIHNGHYESLDHILVSQEFVRQNPQHIGYVEYVKVLNDHLLDDTLSNDRIPRWQSDHGQVVASIRLRE